jgi:CBS domain-containing protein
MGQSDYYDVQRVFLRSFTARDIAEPLLSFDATTPADAAKTAMSVRGHDVAGVRKDGLVCGYLIRQQLQEGACGDYALSFDEAPVLADNAPLTEVIRALHHAPVAFVKILGEVGGLVTRTDLQDPPVRMWLFGLITAIELRFRMLIERRFVDESWMQYLSPARIEKARLLQEERRRRNQEPTLLDCLQFSDQIQIIARDEPLRSQIGFVSRRRADTVGKFLEALRNNLAHSQDIIASDWDTILAIADNLERLIGLVSIG